MAMSLNANWLRAFRRQGVQPVYLVKLYVTDIDIRTASTDRLGFDSAYPAVVQSVTPFSSAVDPITRVPEINESTMIFGGAHTSAASWARQLLITRRLKGKKVVVLWGTPTLAEVDFEKFFAGVLDRVLPKADNSVEITIKNGLGILRDTLVVGAWAAEHPVDLVEDIWLNRADLPAELLDTTTLDPALYTAMSHFVLSRAGDIAQHADVSAFDLIAEIAQTVDGIFADTEDGKLRFVPYDDTKAVTEDWVDTVDFWDFEQTALQENVITEFVVKFMYDLLGSSGFPKRQHRVSDTDALANFAYPGTTGQATKKEYVNRWLNGRGVLTTTNMTAVAPAAGATFQVFAGRAFAFCGARQPGFPGTPQPADAQASATRNLYVMIDDEFIEVDQVTPSTTVKATLQLEDTDTGAAQTQQVTQLLTMRVKTRGALLSTPAAHGARLTQGGSGATVYDYTIAVKMVQQRLKRFSNGCPIVKLKTKLDKFGLQIADFITLTTSRYAAYGNDGLTTTTKWEAIGKEVHPDEGYILWTFAWVTGPVAPTPLELHKALDIIRGTATSRATATVTRGETSDYKVISGLTVSVTAGLTVSVAAGVASSLADRVELAAAVSLTLTASKDSWIYFDVETRSVAIIEQATGAVAPTFSAGQLPLSKAVAGVATVTLTPLSNTGTIQSDAVMAASLSSATRPNSRIPNGDFGSYSR